MSNSAIRLRISAKNIYTCLFRDVRIYNFFDFAGYKLSNHAISIEGRAKGLAQFCNSPHPTTRRWINGEASPKATATFMIYGAVLAHIYNGNQEKMLYEFIKWHDRTLLSYYFDIPTK